MLPTRLKALRQILGLRQAQVAATAGVSPALISRIEDGSRPNVSGTILVQLAEVLSTTTDYLLGRTDDPGIPNERLSEAERALLTDFRAMQAIPWQETLLNQARQLRTLYELTSPDLEQVPKTSEQTATAKSLTPVESRNGDVGQPPARRRGLRRRPALPSEAEPASATPPESDASSDFA